jgi:hypothetical protein
METVLPKSLFPAVAGRPFLNIAAGGLPPTVTAGAAQKWLQHLPGIDSHRFAPRRGECQSQTRDVSGFLTAYSQRRR